MSAGPILAALVLLAMSGPVVASTCPKTCGDQVATCRRTECAGLDGPARRACIRGCRTRSTCTAPGAAIRTGAYVVTECISDRSGAGEVSSFTQRLVIRRGNCDPLTIKELRGPPVPDPAGVCRLFGIRRVGAVSVLGGVFQRIGVLVDGSAVVFEVTDEFSVFGSLLPLAPLDRGIFFVRRDGSGLQRLGDATHAPTFSTAGLGSVNETHFAVSPNHSTIAFSDIGPGSDGLPALQIFTLDLATGGRRQVTRLNGRQAPGGHPALGLPSFIDDQTIVFQVLVDPADEDLGYQSFSVQTDGSDLHALPLPMGIPGGTVIPRFDVTRRGTNVAEVVFQGEPQDPFVIRPGFFREIFLFDRRHALQLTTFRQFDTHQAVLNRGRVFFLSSADPLGRNAGRMCQIFSIDRFAGHLRQLTHFVDDKRPLSGCTFVGPVCTLSSGVLADPVTGTLLFTSNCDPFGTNPYGDQIFAMRPDGSGLRQLTSLRGMRELADGKVAVELPGPAGYSAPIP